MLQSESRFLKACRRQPVDATPVWFMRQAGRYMAEYRKVRARHSILEICKTPELATEVTVTAVEKLGVDAAIIFADLLLPVEPMGMRLRFAAGEGPVLENPLRDERAIAGLRSDGAGELGYVAEAIRRVHQHFGGRIPVIGFAGAPFTLASYMVEGGGSHSFVHTKTLLYREPALWAALMEKLCAVLEPYLLAQVEAGAAAVQLFDSWVGCLSEEDYRRYALPYSWRLIEAVQRRGVPVIHFGTGTAALLGAMQEAGAHALGVDWRIPLARAWQEVGYRPAIQGNLDPVALFAPQTELRRRVQEVLNQAAGRHGHIFNLGHGILPDTPVKNVRAVVEWVHELSAAQQERTDKSVG
ncbi:MAG TPA: uroporphyrinogen decarboxylase [Candidatus Acidoferrales bacterium]|nr:uroporphyrinogen decarboxylase [Candidatus Acidoferrales bacterium]